MKRLLAATASAAIAMTGTVLVSSPADAAAAGLVAVDISGNDVDVLNNVDVLRNATFLNNVLNNNNVGVGVAANIAANVCADANVAAVIAAIRDTGEFTCTLASDPTNTLLLTQN